MLPEEEVIYLLPVARLASRTVGVPVFIARGALPLVSAWQGLADALLDLGIAGVDGRHEVLRPASFREICAPHLSDPRTVIGPVATTVRSVLSMGERDGAPEGGINAPAVGGHGGGVDRSEGRLPRTGASRDELLEEIADTDLDPAVLALFRRFYAAPVLAKPAAVRDLGERVSSSVVLSELDSQQADLPPSLRLTPRERTFVRVAMHSLARDGGELANRSWSDTWLIQQTAINAFHRANNSRGVFERGAQQERSPSVLRVGRLLDGTGFHQRVVGRTLIGVDDSSRTGASAFLLKLLGNAVSPGVRHYTAVMGAARRYGQRATVDLVCSDEQLLYPEEEPERLPDSHLPPVVCETPPDGARRRRRRFGAAVERLRPIAGSAFDAATSRCPMRHDTSLDAFEWFVVRYLRGDGDRWANLVVTEYLPDPQRDRPQFLDLGRKVLDFVRSDLVDFNAALARLEDEDAAFFGTLRRLHGGCRDALDDEAWREFGCKRQLYLRRQEEGVRAVTASPDTIRAYFAGTEAFGTVRAALRASLELPDGP
ncbi:MAG: hypothetical protein ACRDT6_00040 [Micromonosporaceae bacterium]